jgi:uncharacterized protein YodC (DUF2158 family)
VFNKQGLKMADSKYEPGDFVQLKSSGPKMVVEEYFSYNNSYDCSWFAGTKHNKTRFNESALQIYDADNE